MEEKGQTDERNPEANDGDCPHQLIIVRRQSVLDILEEHLDIPQIMRMFDDCLDIGIQQGFTPRAGALQRVVQAVPGDQPQCRTQLEAPDVDGIHLHSITYPVGR